MNVTFRASRTSTVFGLVLLALPLIAAGEALSNDGDVSGNHGGFDGWVVKFGPQAEVASGEAQAGKDLALRATLDPIGNSAKIGYRTPCEHSELEIEIANVLGTPVMHVHATEEASGDHSRSLDVSHLPNGLYFVTARACGLAQTRPILIVR